MAAGRKRKAGVKRINGRISRRESDRQAQRSLEQQDAMSVARSARERVFGVDRVHSGTELAGSFVGRLYLTGEIRRHQLDAARAFCVEWVAYSRALGLPAQPRAVDLSGIRSGSAYEITPEQQRTAVARWDASVWAVTEANMQCREGALYPALYYCVLLDQSHTHMVGDMRLGLNALARHYRIAEADAA